jgi:hypothetical protein
MTLFQNTKTKSWGFIRNNKLLFTCNSIKEVIQLLVLGVELKRSEVDDAIVDMLLNDYNLAEFGDLNGKYLYSKRGNIL